MIFNKAIAKHADLNVVCKMSSAILNSSKDIALFICTLIFLPVENLSGCQIGIPTPLSVCLIKMMNISLHVIPVFMAMLIFLQPSMIILVMSNTIIPNLVVDHLCLIECMIILTAIIIQLHLMMTADMIVLILMGAQLCLMFDD